ncbi:MAG: terminase large subunit, partial [Lactococcus lactis]
MKIDLTQTHDVIGTYHSLNYEDIREEYQDPATKYAFDVLDEKYTTGYLMQLACFRHLQDLKRIGNEDFPFNYEVKHVKRLMKFSKMAPNVDTMEPTKLMEWQKFMLSLLIGWRNKEGG